MKNTDLKNVAEELKHSETAMCYTSGRSMYPLFRHHRDIAVIARLNRKLRLHDVPLYRKTGHDKLVLHRIIKINDDGSLVIRGDNTYNNEYDIKHEDIVGILKGFYRNGKYVDCEKSHTYNIYIIFMRLFYPLRYLWCKKLRPILSKIKHILLK